MYLVRIIARRSMSHFTLHEQTATLCPHDQTFSTLSTHVVIKTSLLYPRPNRYTPPKIKSNRYTLPKIKSKGYTPPQDQNKHLHSTPRSNCFSTSEEGRKEGRKKGRLLRIYVISASLGRYNYSRISQDATRIPCYQPRDEGRQRMHAKLQPTTSHPTCSSRHPP